MSKKKKVLIQNFKVIEFYDYEELVCLLDGYRYINGEIWRDRFKMTITYSVKQWTPMEALIDFVGGGYARDCLFDSETLIQPHPFKGLIVTKGCLNKCSTRKI